MKLALAVRDLLLASWRTDPASVARALPAPLEPHSVDGEHLVTLVAFRVVRARLGRVPAPPFSQLNVRLYTSYRDEPAVFFLRAFVTPPGLGGVVFRAPYRAARVRVRPGSAQAPGKGLEIRYRPDEAGEPGPLGRHELGIFESAGLRAFRIRRAAHVWRRAALADAPRAELLLALGFEPHGEPSLLYAAEAAFEADVPPAELR